MTSLKVLQILPEMDKRGGIARYVADQCAHLPQNIATSFVTGFKADNFVTRKPIHRVWMCRKPLFLMSLTFSFMAQFFGRRKESDLTHAHGASCFSQDLVTAHSCHKAWFLSSLKATRPFTRAWFLKILNPLHYFSIFIEWYQYQPAHHRRVISVSEQVKKELVAEYGLAPERIVVIHNGVNCEEFAITDRSGKRERTRVQHGIGMDELVYLFVANEFRRKGLGVLLQAFSHLPEGSRLFVVGGGDFAPFVSDVQRLGLEHRVLYVGRQEDIQAYYAASDAFVFPTTYEPFGLVITEAMASGLPVIVSRLAGAAELLRHGKDGLLLQDPQNVTEIVEAMKILRDQSMRAEMSAAAVSTARQHDWSLVAARIAAAYHEVWTEKKSQP